MILTRWKDHHPQVIVSNIDQEGHGGWKLYLDGSTLKFHIVYKDYDANAQVSTVSVDTWQHVAGVYNAVDDEIRVYLDGSGGSAVSFSGSGTIPVTPGNLYIGVDELIHDYFSGKIDEVRISSEALYEDPTVPTPIPPLSVDSDNTIALWHFDCSSALNVGLNITPTPSAVTSTLKEDDDLPYDAGYHYTNP